MHTEETAEVDIDQEDADDIARRIEQEEYERFEGAAALVLIVGAGIGGFLVWAFCVGTGWCR